jgi:phosphatidate cytidylyltransferase
VKDDRRAPTSPAIGERRGDLMLRVASATALAPVAIGAALFGGWPFVLFWTAAAIGVHWEWSDVTGGAIAPRLVGIAALAATGGLAGAGQGAAALLVLLAGLLAAAVLSGIGRGWAIAGVAYAGTVVIGPVILRRDPDFGLVALIFLFAVVWASDIVAFFAGRLIGGPKLARAVSPNKTWSGAIGGAFGAVAAGSIVAAAAGLPNSLAVVSLALLLSVVSQAGDLFESGVKRRFGVKDSSRLIPGHGGLMDRLDGFLAAAGAAALLGMARGGLDGAARGLLSW